MAVTVSDKKIAKNTLLLYFRMLITMFVSLYASREILRILGIEDFGVYNIIAGVIVLFSFVNGALVSSTQRFLNYEIGKGNIKRQQTIFSSSLTIYVVFCCIIIVIAETLGLWFVNHKLNIPTDRLNAANWVYQFSLITFCLNILRVPFNAAVIAHERMSFYAYLSIVEVVMKLLILFPLLTAHMDKLVLYAILLALVSLFILIFYQIYCLREFTTCKYKLIFNIQEYSSLLGFSLWSLFGSASNMVVAQGVNIVFNLFYGVTLNASMGLTNQIKNAVNSFLTNFQTAFTPQIVKSYAVGERKRFQQLILFTSKYSYFLTILVVLPFIYNADFIIAKWLTIVPIYLIPFTKWSLLSLTIDSLSAPLGIAVQATGKIRRYQIFYSLLSFSVLPLAVFVTYINESPADVFVIWVVCNLVMYIWKIWFVSRLIKLPIKLYLEKVVAKTILVTVFGVTALYLFDDFCSLIDWPKLLVSVIYISFVLLVSIYTLGLGKEERQSISYYLNQRKKALKYF